MIEDLRAIALFAGLSRETLGRLAQIALRRTFRAGQVILTRGEPCEAAYFIAWGEVRVYRLSLSGREQVLIRLGPGQAFNTVPPFRSPCANHATVQALTDVTLYAIPSDGFRQAVRECPDLAAAVLEDFANRLDHLTDLVEDLALYTVRGRLARFLLDQAESGRVARQWTQEEMAAHLGTVRDVVGRTLRAFADEGLVRMDRHRILLLDPAGLREEAQR